MIEAFEEVCVSLVSINSQDKCVYLDLRNILIV